MFDSNQFPAALDNELFEQWLEEGRQSLISYSFLLIVWDDFESAYKPVYAENRNEIDQFERYGQAKGHESLVAAYDLFSESRVK
ncbi:MAG: hypothetical protein ACNS60_07215 [Candidatus Cyclobacteriaceae bacterium M2_1C_046]